MGIYILMSKPSTLDAPQTAGVALEYDTVWADRSLTDEGLGRPSPSSALQGQPQSANLQRFRVLRPSQQHIARPSAQCLSFSPRTSRVSQKHTK